MFSSNTYYKANQLIVIIKHDQKIAHQKSTPQKSSRTFSVAFSTRRSVSFTNISLWVSVSFQRIVTFSSGYCLEIANGCLVTFSNGIVCFPLSARARH